MPLPLVRADYGPLAEMPVFRRHGLVGRLAVEAGIAEVRPAGPNRQVDLTLFHTPQYLQALRTGEPDSLASTAFPWFPGIYDVAVSRTAGFFDAVDAAIATQAAAGFLGNGGHHAPPGRGGALGVVNEIGLGARYALRQELRVFVLDLDLHFGNGTAMGLGSEPGAFLFDYHGHASDFFEVEADHLFRNLKSEPTGKVYLSRLGAELPAALDRFRPDLCLYLAGMDVFGGTPNAHLKLSFEDIERRENLVFRELSTRGIPVVYAHGGGYASEETVARLHLLTARAAYRHYFEERPGDTAGEAARDR